MGIFDFSRDFTATCILICWPLQVSIGISSPHTRKPQMTAYMHSLFYIPVFQIYRQAFGWKYLTQQQSLNAFLSETNCYILLQIWKWVWNFLLNPHWVKQKIGFEKNVNSKTHK